MRCVLEICNCLKRNCKDLNPPIIPCVLNSKWRKTCGCVREFKVKIDFDTSYLLSLPNPVFSIQVLLNFANGRVAKNSQALRMYVQFNGLIINISFYTSVFHVPHSVRWSWKLASWTSRWNVLAQVHFHWKNPTVLMQSRHWVFLIPTLAKLVGKQLQKPWNSLERAFVGLSVAS